MNDLGHVNTYAGIVPSQRVVPVVVVVFKQFFDQVPQELSAAAVIDGAWNNFLWPFIIVMAVAGLPVAVG